ncbi:MAG TPA: serine hydrolase domain-containing protein [Verrucomicrobiae bacterium]|nr:serine hydrolase domain-containing protein [Verrucomicrobiae bacterium]
MKKYSPRLRVFLFFLLQTASLALAQTSATLAPDLRGKIDEAVRQVLSATGVPSASVAIVHDGRIAYLQAYGDARVEPRVPATPETRYSIGSISKQFAATAILMLAEQGKLSLDDPVARFVPDLTRAREITIRQVLSHTSGYQDYWPQDYVPPFMLQPVSADQILDRWAHRPLDFEPGTDWQYSNTGYVIAGLIVERASGQPLVEFLRQHIFIPLGMKSVMNVDQERLNETDATGYTRYGLGPLRVAHKEGKGWLFATGELAMRPEDLAIWDISLINQTLLKPASYGEMESATVLKNGIANDYGLGVDVQRKFSRRAILHGGEVSGFVSENMVFPDDRVAVVVLTNEDADHAARPIAQKIAALLFPQEDASKEEQQARQILVGLQHGKINRALFSDNANFYFSEQALKDFATGLGPLGKPQSLTETSRKERGGMTYREFLVKFPHKNVEIGQRTLPDGKIEQFMVGATE